MKNIFLLSLALCLTFLASGQTKKVIFVCEHGVAKSVIAAANFNKLAKERGLEWEAECRATFPDSTLTPATRSGLKTDNITPNRAPQKLTLADTVGADRIILFTPLPADYKTTIPIENWSSILNIDAAYPLRRDAITKQLNILLDKLEKQ